MTSAVIAHATSVSMNVPSMAMIPCRTGLFVCAAAWAMATEPSPDSFEKTPRIEGDLDPVDGRRPWLVAFPGPRASSDSPTDRRLVQVGKFVGKGFGPNEIICFVSASVLFHKLAAIIVGLCLAVPRRYPRLRRPLLSANPQRPR